MFSSKNTNSSLNEKKKKISRVVFVSNQKRKRITKLKKTESIKFYLQIFVLIFVIFVVCESMKMMQKKIVEEFFLFFQNMPKGIGNQQTMTM